MRKARKIEEILTALVEGASATFEILDEILPNYHKSYKAARRVLYGGTGRNKESGKSKAEKQKYYSLLNQLKRQRLIECKKAHNGTFWKITTTGLKKLKFIRENKTEYICISDDKLKIVMYDIPEKEKKKRFWLREVLKNLDFKMLQKSVWIGKNKIPETLFYHMSEKAILNYIHVLEISKKGTIKELT